MTITFIDQDTGNFVDLAIDEQGRLQVVVASGITLEGDINVDEVDISSLPGTSEADIAAIKAAVEILDNFISGSEGQVDVVSLGRTFEKDNDTGAGAISFNVTASGDRRLTSISLHFDTAPISSGILSITLNANVGAAYDTLLVSETMSGVSNFLFAPDYDLFLETNDAIDVAYDNSDGRTYGVQVTMEIV